MSFSDDFKRIKSASHPFRLDSSAGCSRFSMLTYVCGLSRGGRGSPHNTAHMRQHGKFENFDVWNRDFLTFWAKIWCFSDLHKIYDFEWKYHQKTVFNVSLFILEWFLINSVNVKKFWFFHHFHQFSWGMFLFWHTLSLSNLKF